MRQSLQTSFSLVGLLVLASSWLLAVGQTHAAPQGDCALESDIATRNDVLMCEPWESESWWTDHGYIRDSSKSEQVPVQASQMTYASVISDGCVSGNCLQLQTLTGNTRSLSIHWPLSNSGLGTEDLQEMYVRYYFKIGTDWTASECSSGTSPTTGGGKLPGFADPRGSLDPGGQCGNGGASSNGIDCWSARGGFNGCSQKTPGTGFPYPNTCEAVDGSDPDIALRLYSYLYVPDNATTHGANAIWDAVTEHNTSGGFDGGQSITTCRRTDPNNPDPRCYCTQSNNFHCGIGHGGQLQRDRWYAVETYVKMNTPGVADGVLRGWVDGVLSYEKTDMLYRKPGHDDLHVRTMWLNIYKGGVLGNCEDSFVYYDQMVIARERIGEIDQGPRPNPPTNLTIIP